MIQKLLITLCLIRVLPVAAQNTIGLPEIVNYNKHTYKAGTQNWDVCQDANGILYFANNEGVLTFDGTYWKTYPLPNKTIVRSVVIGPGGRLYAGGQNEIGYFDPGSRGALTYHSIKDLIPAQHRSFADVWDIVYHGNDLFFRTNERIYHLQDKNVTVYPAVNWLFLGRSGPLVIAQDYVNGLLIYRNGHWAPITTQQKWPEGFLVTASLAIGKDSTLLTTLKHGIYLYTANHIQPMRSPTLDRIADYLIYGASLISSDHIALATTLQGCIIIDRKGNPVQLFSRADGLQKNNVLTVFPDRNRNLWLGLDNGIDFIAYNSAIKNIFPDKQNEGAGYSATIFKNRLYIATTNGLYQVPLYEQEDMSFVKGGFQPVLNTKGQVWNLSHVNDRLLMGHHEGAYLVDGATATRIDNSSGYWAFLPYSPILPSSLVAAGTYHGIKFFDYRNQSFLRPAATADANFESARFMTITDNAIWVSHPYKGVFKVAINAGQEPVITSYSDKQGLSLTTNGNYIFKIKNRLVVATEKGMYEYNQQKDRFEPSAYFNDIFGSTIIRYMKEDSYGNIWFVFNKSLGVADFTTGKVNMYYITELNEKMVSGFEQVFPVDSSNVFVGSEKGYFHINYAKYKNANPAISVQLREVRAIGKTDSLLFGGYFPGGIQSASATSPLSVSYKWNSFHFEFSAPYYEQQSNIEYSCHLKGYDKKWGDWSSKTEKEYAYLPAGSYEFQVKARSNLGNESPVFSYCFVVQPPWYQTWWAYALYTGALMYIAYFVYRWQKEKFIRQKKQYEEEQKRLQYLHQLELEKSEKEIIKLRNENLEAEIQHKNKEMASATMHLVKKGELITKMKDELQRLTKSTESEESLESFKKMIKTLGEEDKMDKDWEHFTIHFDKVHNDFFVALKEQHPNLTANEMKLCAYLRMNLSTKEMAQLMNISVRGVEISRYRLRKKLQIPTNTNLFTYLLDFHSENNKPSGELLN
ncbi:MAG TPA: triple tyrosine motif-containing protein [Chitinophagaceae bacterium]|nr:triple tyrosine motif-containing protein [Chitinophagaceae bacterium]